VRRLAQADHGGAAYHPAERREVAEVTVRLGAGQRHRVPVELGDHGVVGRAGGGRRCVLAHRRDGGNRQRTEQRPPPHRAVTAHSEKVLSMPRR
jgi:hypothetical protein